MTSLLRADCVESNWTFGDEGANEDEGPGWSDVRMFGADRCFRFLFGALLTRASRISSSSSSSEPTGIWLSSRKEPLKLALRMLFPPVELTERLEFGRIIISTSSEAPSWINGWSLFWVKLKNLKMRVTVRNVNQSNQHRAYLLKRHQRVSGSSMTTPLASSSANWGGRLGTRSNGLKRWKPVGWRPSSISSSDATPFCSTPFSNGSSSPSGRFPLNVPWLALLLSGLLIRGVVSSGSKDDIESVVESADLRRVLLRSPIVYTLRLQTGQTLRFFVSQTSMHLVW